MHEPYVDNEQESHAKQYKITDTIDYNTIDIKQYQEIGSGTYGKVYDLGEIVYKDMSELYTSNNNYVDTSFIREIASLISLTNCPNIVKIKDVVVSEHKLGYSMLKYKQTLSHIISTIDIANIKKIIYQLLVAVEHAHERFIIHRDIKPTNILLDESDNAYLADWGLSTIDYSLKEKKDYNVQTIWYRAPEVLLNINTYNNKIDMWSIGIIMYELISHKLGIIGGDEYTIPDQLTYILKTFGFPTAKEYPEMRNIIKIKYYEIYNSLIHQTNSKFIKDMAQYNVPDDYIFLISKLLKYNPDDRYSAIQALQDKYFDSKVSHTKLSYVNMIDLYNVNMVDYKKIQINNPWMDDEMRLYISLFIADAQNNFDIEVSLSYMIMKIYDIISTNTIINKNKINLLLMAIFYYVLRLHNDYEPTFSTLNTIFRLSATKKIRTRVMGYIYAIPYMLNCYFYHKTPLLAIKIINKYISNRNFNKMLLYFGQLVELSQELLMYDINKIVGSCLLLAKINITVISPLTKIEEDNLEILMDHYKFDKKILLIINNKHRNMCNKKTHVSAYCEKYIPEIYDFDLYLI